MLPGLRFVQIDRHAMIYIFYLNRLQGVSIATVTNHQERQQRKTTSAMVLIKDLHENVNIYQMLTIAFETDMSALPNGLDSVKDAATRKRRDQSLR
mmetsp:Transcript_15807/g.39722  ORF Transcript_15807/g.39722 Transcript_15807/m.39722 type:complete len:96 (+) Transcript_15807:1311-1598(+)